MADVTAGEVLSVKAPGAGETVRLPVMLLDTSGDPVTGVAYDAAGVTVAIAKPGASAFVAWATLVGNAFATENWDEIGYGNYDIILSGDVAGEAAVLDTAGHLRVYVAFTATRGDTGIYKVVPADTARDDQWTDARAAAITTVGTVVDAIQAKTDNLPDIPAATGDAMTLQDGAITAAVIAQHAIDADALAADLDSYGARVEIIDDDGAGTPADRYCVTWLKNMEMLTTGVTEPTIQVVALADGTDLVAETALTAVGSTGAYQYVETANRIVDGAAYMVLVTATIAEATRTWPHFIGRDSTAS